MNDAIELWGDLLPYQLNLMLNLNQGLALFRQTQTLSRQKHLQKHNNELFQNIFFRHFSPLTKETLSQPIFFNTKTKLKFSSY